MMTFLSNPPGYSRPVWIFTVALMVMDVAFMAIHHAGFNRHVWHALLVVFLVSVLVWMMVASSITETVPYCFDPKHRGIEVLTLEGGDFEHHSQRYQDLAKLLITLSTGVIAFLINTLANAKQPSAPIIGRVDWSAPLIVGLFGVSIATLVLFMVTQTVWYEEYCHAEKHNTYTISKYRICNFLGYNGLMAFVVGIAWLSSNIF